MTIIKQDGRYIEDVAYYPEDRCMDLSTFLIFEHHELWYFFVVGMNDVPVVLVLEPRNTPEKLSNRVLKSLGGVIEWVGSKVWSRGTRNDL